MEYLGNNSKRGVFSSLNEDILKITVLTTNTPYLSRKMRRICAYTHQRPRRKHDQHAVKMDDPNITMEEYIRLEEEKACRRGKVYNWETATYGHITEYPGDLLNENDDAGGVFINLEISKCWSLEISRQLFNTFLLIVSKCYESTGSLGISSTRDFLGTTLYYTLIRDSMPRLCHRLITYNIAGRSQAFWLLIEERLPGIDDDSSRPERQQVAVAGSPEITKGAPNVDEGDQLFRPPYRHLSHHLQLDQLGLWTFYTVTSLEKKSTKLVKYRSSGILCVL
ncbi:hypothetical protein Tco_0446566 [Tanacetum coccineum]